MSHAVKAKRLPDVLQLLAGRGTNDATERENELDISPRASYRRLFAEPGLRTSNTKICGFRIIDESYDAIFFSVIRTHIGIPDNSIFSIV